MEGISSPKTLRMLGLVSRKRVTMLLDTKSTHNFVDPRVVQRTGIPVSPKQVFNVTVAGGDKLKSEGLYKAVKIKCQRMDIVTVFHIFPINGCQMVLGVDWLQTLDEMTFNFK